jgi:4-hydroxy-4-methyl-2-oxoglutarate aldolase
MIDYEVIVNNLGSSVLSDVLDGSKLRCQAMSSKIRPIQDDMVIVGRAQTMLMTDQYDTEKDTFSLQFQAIDGLRDGEVMMVCSNGSVRAALWGELLSTAAIHRGARGAVVDGMVRDVGLIRKLKFPVFAGGVMPVSSKGRVYAVDYGCPVMMGGVMVYPGDLVVADLDGIVVVPERIAEKAVEKALEVVSLEKNTREELRNGAGLYDVYKKYGAV